jgi:hypothetical protein
LIVALYPHSLRIARGECSILHGKLQNFTAANGEIDGNIYKSALPGGEERFNLAF